MKRCIWCDGDSKACNNTYRTNVEELDEEWEGTAFSNSKLETLNWYISLETSGMVVSSKFFLKFLFFLTLFHYRTVYSWELGQFTCIKNQNVSYNFYVGKENALVNDQHFVPSLMVIKLHIKYRFVIKGNYDARY